MGGGTSFFPAHFVFSTGAPASPDMHACAAARWRQPWNNLSATETDLPARPLSSSAFPSYSTNLGQSIEGSRVGRILQAWKAVGPQGWSHLKEARLQESFQNVPFFLASLVPTVLSRSWEAFLALPGSLKVAAGVASVQKGTLSL